MCIQPRYSHHSGHLDAASVVQDGVIYLFGGFRHDKNTETYPDTNRLTSLDLNGTFRCIAITGSLPFPRYESIAWSYAGNLYFGFGNTAGDHREPGVSYIQGGTWIWGSGRGRTNQILKFDTKRKSFSLVSLSGPTPDPRWEFGVAKLDGKIYIHGGYARTYLNDTAVNPKYKANNMVQLDLGQRKWADLGKFGFSDGMNWHSLSVISPSQLMLIGGKGRGGQSDLVMIYDTKSDSWEKGPSLPPKIFTGITNAAYHMHKAVEVREDGRVSKVVCVGGFLTQGTYSRSMLVFNIPK